jgi:dihydrolipoamide dehydrogenase
MADHDAEHSDLVILGGGSGGYATAFRASQLGMSVTLIEADKIGGTCLHRGCIPTKALLHAAEVAELVRSASTVGVKAHLEGIDVPNMLNYQNGIVERLYGGLMGLVRQHRITVVPGKGEFVGERTVRAASSTYTGVKAVVLATGARARTLPGIETGARVITSDEALRLDAVPQRAVVLGGGVIGVEFASIWASLGAEVTIVEALPRIIATEEPWSSRQLERAFRKRGITVMTNAKVSGAKETAHGVSVEITDGDTLEADVLLLAVGRHPRSAGLGYEEHGVRLDAGFVWTDDRLLTTADGVYAVGDLVAGPQLAHRGFQHGIFVAEDIAGLAPIPVQDHQVPRVTYTHPEVASVGFDETAARERCGQISTSVYDLAGNGRSQILQTSGGIKVIRSGTMESGGPIVGVHMVGDRISELIGEAQLAVAWEALPEEIAHFVHAHPTQNEALGEAMLAMAGTPLHAHR